MTQQNHSLQLDSANNASCWHEDFLQMLPKIEEQARYKFRHLKGDHQDEAVQEVICNCCLAYARLVEQGRVKETDGPMPGYRPPPIQNDLG